MIEAVIFDMDGVISDTQKLHAKVESEILGEFGINISPEEVTERYAGVKTEEFFDDLLRSQPKPYDLKELLNKKWKQMAEMGDVSVEAVEGSKELIQNLHGAGYKMAVGSASNFEYVERVIENLGLREYFGFLITGDMVKKGKPDPEIFLLAASKLGVEPEKCVVIEDGRSGMRAAKSGNMKCIGLVKSKTAEYPTSNLVLSLNEITLDYLKHL